ncbi:hypothetical protein C1645_811203 [Glomus cerebriforme]|uniref:Uncharacterized protein n=1 Tax=Glomus cerebriforme TaxID=658196 RepID=A0A397TXT4_9GLOM|nr:hypothetical protein C1645_811203 [Glomus cerebriforme]
MELEKKDLKRIEREFRSYCMDCKKKIELEINEEIMIEEIDSGEDLSILTNEEWVIEEENNEIERLEGLFIRVIQGEQRGIGYWYDVGKMFRRK